MALVPGDRLRFQNGENVLFNRELAKYRWLLRQVAHTEVTGTQVHRDVGDVRPIYGYLAAIGGSEANNDVEAGGLTGSIGAQESNHFPLVNMKAYPIHYPAATKGLTNFVSREGVHLSLRHPRLDDHL